ncbi:MAG: DNA mismatch repair protein MutS [Thermodesulfobacteriota bacterium]|nr:DNA mismatch repair protein MutS [Thermodesulfobacteriota bacterium]
MSTVKTTPVKTTPMIKQYLSIKEQYTDAILFYRMGDFYEMFFEDAETAASVLEVALTSRNKNEAEPVPMCGVPVKAADVYIGRLIDNGFKVAVCDQIEDPATAKGLVKREVVRVVTPGMIIDNELLDTSTNNYVLALSRSNGAVGISYIDISTGTFRLSESANNQAVGDEVRRIAPSEVVVPASARTDDTMAGFMSLFPETMLTFLDDNEFDDKAARKRLTEQFKTRSLEGFGCEWLTSGLSAAGALLSYVSRTQKQEVSHITGVDAYSIDHYLLLDDTTRRNLELTLNLRTGGRQGTLVEILDNCATAMGSRLLRHWIQYPLLDPRRITERLDAVAEVRENISVRNHIREGLKTVFDLERLASKLVMGRANARDLLALKRSLQSLPALREGLAELSSPLFAFDKHLASAALDELAGLADLLESAFRDDAPPTITEGGMIKPDYHPKLSELIAISRDSKGWLARMEAREKEETGINALKVRYNKVFGYYIDIPKTRMNEVPDHYIRKQTLVNSERYITDELKEFESKALGAEEQRATLELEIFNDIRDRVMAKTGHIYTAARFVAGVDVLCNFAEVADSNDYVKPAINDAGHIDIQAGRHPVVEKMLAGERYVPNSVRLDNQENQLLIITGPNMAGKSTVLRQVALFSIMAQMGCFVPGKSASLCIVDRIFTRVGALDNLSSGQSTFMVEMEETANIINNATAQSLVVIDEIGRGTSTYDGLSIAWAVAEHLHDLDGRGVKTLFATHYHELTELENRKSRIKNFNIAVKEWNDEIIFLRKLVEGSTARSYGIQVARLAGIPDNVISRAKHILFDIEQGNAAFAAATVQKTETEKQDTGPVQLSFFDEPENTVISKLKNIDISRMTPLAALNYLNSLKKKAEKASSGHR